MDKGLPVPKWVLIIRPKILQNLSSQFVYPSPKVWDFDEKRLHRESVVHDLINFQYELNKRLNFNNIGPTIITLVP